MAVHTLPRGARIAPMPARISEFGTEGPKLQGGLPPVPWRNAWTRAGDTGRGARVGFPCKTIKAEVFGDSIEWKKEN